MCQSCLFLVWFRQQLRESSEELKCLEARLRAAYVSKELAAQIAEKRAAAKQEKVSSSKQYQFSSPFLKNRKKTEMK